MISTYTTTLISWLITLIYFAPSAVAKWTAKVGDSWDCVLDNPPRKINPETKIYDIDLFDSSKKLIKTLHSQDKIVICYFSAGTFEEWRPDAKNFTRAELGKPLNEWEGERWVNITSSNVFQIMQNRILLAKTKGCDAIDPDNIDGYAHKTGLKWSKQDSIAYVRKLSKYAKKHGLAIGLKNGGDIIKQVLSYVDFSVQEQCGQYGECKQYQPFIKAKKPVFHIEYPKKSKRSKIHWPSKVYKEYCTFKHTGGFSTILKHWNLNEWVYQCPN
ncbi:uncharacterized protein CPAR2_300570 [Candida parapsilosis]|uniref:alpha-galactosidase n=1 Tax=Candida parapsilosis (strain CDC 317 / ATCC MYA-4646) TaxID=578454 RepID=G8B8W9_CANPC|nr:uncharacterized protein CPAR2_300570 [Candida parapsilosis]CCE41068.1 hypothetical protein CPAR2_300570 [Candida parapsilosis]